MHTKKKNISLYHIKKVAAKLLAVLFSVGMIICNFDFSYAADYTPSDIWDFESLEQNQYINSVSINDNTITISMNSPGDYHMINVPSKLSDFTSIDFDFTVTSDFNSGFIFQFLGSSGTLNGTLTNATHCWVTTNTSTPFNISRNGNSPYSGHVSIINNGNEDNLKFATRVQYTGNLTFTISNIVLDGKTSPTPAITSKYTFQNGWLSVIDLGASNTAYNFDLSTSFNVNSGLISQNWSETSQTYWFSDSLPTVESSYTNQGTLIPWERGNPRNVFGQTKNGVYTLSGTSTGRYLYILNPAFRAIADAEHPSIENHAVNVSGLTNGMKAYVYELTATASLSGVVNAISTVTVDGQTTFANTGSVTAGETSEDLTESFVNSDNVVIVQNQGGGNQNTTAQTINNYLENIQNVLDNFVNQFVSLLTAPISHIQQLVASGTNFFNAFGSLFTFLPATAYDVIIGAFIVMVVIGVIKLLL